MADDRFSRARFIRLGAALGVGAAGASVIAACGGGGEGAGNGGGAATTEAAPTSGAEETTQAAPETTTGGDQAGGGGGAIAGESEVPPGTAVPFDDEAGRPAILVHLEGGDFAAYSAVCTHAQCTVAYQEQSAQIACPCHGSVFDPANGAAVVNGPAQMPLPEIPVEVRDGEVFRA